MGNALLIVDVQKDFCEDGALAVAGGNQVADDIADYIYTNHKKYDTIITSQDWHAAPPNNNCGHFALKSAPNFVTSWPVHCVAYSEGSDLHESIFDIEHLVDFNVRKGNGAQSYSAFEGATSEMIGLLGILRSFDITEIDVAGLAYDYCVKSSAIDAAILGYKTRVLSMLTAAVSDDNRETTINALTDCGVQIV